MEWKDHSGIIWTSVVEQRQKAVLEVSSRPHSRISDWDHQRPDGIGISVCVPEATYYEKWSALTQSSSISLSWQRFFVCSPPKTNLCFEDDEFFADLVFYNRLLRCFVVIELKPTRLRIEDIKQLQMYVNYYDRNEKAPLTVKPLSHRQRDKTISKIHLPENNNTILASKCQSSTVRETARWATEDDRIAGTQSM